MDIPVVFLILWESSHIFRTEGDVSCGSFMYSFKDVKVYSFSPYLLEGVFFKKGCYILSNTFFCIYWQYHLILILSSINGMYHIDLFVNIEPALQPRNEFHLIMVNNSLRYCWIQFATILLKIFAPRFIREIGDWPVILFSGVFIWFWNQGKAGFREWVW